MILLIGKTASGKDTILNEIVKLGYEKLVTYTTRPMRPGEIDGINYHYISSEEFLLKDKEGFFAETTSYNVATDETWYYGSAIEDFNRDKVMIVNPDGVKQIRKIKSLNPIVFYIQADEKMIRKRLRKRGDNKKESKRRIAADDRDFFGIEKYVNFSINNNGLFSPGAIAEDVVKKYRNYGIQE
ncbi:guanylate kinase [Clostridium sp. WB02_MRS01]|uniref:guanylate kinase n=1 Tax=Clostridium sp. WB02_MRS01 TaxID=2605777 RepID=UPI0012B3BBE4|nr:guanylate kinase [Clostridium sp. WB02_MRS01]MSS07131.1 guanylate kinase [Clostridium sp. WB02_MRS01]